MTWSSVYCNTFIYWLYTHVPIEYMCGEELEKTLRGRRTYVAGHLAAAAKALPLCVGIATLHHYRMTAYMQFSLIHQSIAYIRCVV